MASSASTPKSLSLAALYEQDYALWLEATLTQLRAGHWSEVDWPNLLEELEDISHRQKNALKSNLRVVLRHLLKYPYQPAQRSNSWHATLREHRLRIADELSTSPSLGRYIPTILAECYQQARSLAADETGLPLEHFPEHLALALDDILNTDFLPN